MKFKIAIFASGSGTNAEEIIKYFIHHRSIEVVVVLTNNPDAFVIKRAQQFGIPFKVFDKGSLMNSDLILHTLSEYQVTHIVLAGFMWLIPGNIIQAFPNRIINIHPALLPKFGGKGMYGIKVHQAVRNAGETETGITIHVIDEKYDEGRIVLQKKCAIESSDDPESIAAKVHQLEHAFYPRAIESWILETDSKASF